MAQSIRISDHLYAHAQRVSAVMDRSLAQQFEFWARLGAAVDAMGITSVQAAVLLGSPEAADALLDAVRGQVVYASDAGSPMLREWHARLDDEVASGRRTAASLLAFSPEAARKSTVTFAPEPESEDAGW